MSEPLDDQYLEWLYSQVGLQDENVFHYDLLNQLNSREFVYLPTATGDENRCEDGLLLRMQFVKSGRMITPSSKWMSMGCSIMEMVIGISRHLSFQAEGEMNEWFWHLIKNLGLIRYDDTRYNERRIDEILERFVWRQYSANGKGGLFPLQAPHDDQRYVELWFQMEAYILELS